MAKLRAMLWSLVRREDDPDRVDWAALACLVLFGLLAGGLIAIMVWGAINIDLPKR